jgi:hypothetical protein
VALSTYCILMCSSARKVEDPHRYRCLRCREPCDLLPALEALDHLLSIGLGGEAVASRSEMLGEGTIRGEKPLDMSWRLEPLHAPLPLPGGLVWILRAVVEIAMLAMFHIRQDLALCRAVALQLVRDDHPWHVCQRGTYAKPLSNFRKNFLAACLSRRRWTTIWPSWRNGVIMQHVA